MRSQPRHGTDGSHRDRPDEPAVPVQPARRPRRFGEWPLALVLLGVGTGLVVVATDHFRWGTVLVGSSVVLATVLRAVLSERRAGLLVVRSRWVDVLTLGTFGIGLTVLALVVPPPDEERSLGPGGQFGGGRSAGIASTAGDVLMTRDLEGSRRAE